jgi:hypothetical protein
MPHASFKINPGVDENETPALNEAGISTTNLVRFIFDRNGIGLVQKLGGWTKFFPSPITSVVRALWAWEDTESTAHLAVGTQNAPLGGTAQLDVITNNVLKNITPKDAQSDLLPVATTVAGSPLVTITDAGFPYVTFYDSVYIATQVSVGGIVLFGLYACDPTGYIGSTSFTILSTDVLGNPLPAVSSSSSPVLPSFTTVNGTFPTTVNLPNHGYSVGSTFPVLVHTTVGGIDFFGNYVVQSVVDADNFVINGTLVASSNDTATINNGNLRLIYNFGVGAIPAGTGYGVLGYGRGGYGTGAGVTPSTGNPINADDWTLDNWGAVLLSCANSNGASALNYGGTPFQPIYQWDSEGGSPTATVIANAPPVNDGMFVAMPQRQIIAWGSTFTGIADPLLIRWCDVGNYDSWVGTVVNQAGSYRLPKGSKIVGCIQGPQQGLVWTDLGLWSMQYIGPPYVYSFNEVGSGCGMIARKAAASINGSVYWMGASQFFTLSANGVEPVPCPVWDVIFQDLDTTNLQKIRVAVNSRFGEITWFYPSKSDDGEINAYVKLNVFMNVWDYGQMSRSAWVDQSVLGPPIGSDPISGYLYQHETSTDADGQAMLSNFRTGYFAMSEADLKTFVDQVWPDMKWGYFGGTQNATVNITFYTTDYAGQSPSVYGPFPMTQNTKFITPRFRGRLVSIELSSNDLGSFWRIGNIRYRLQQDGKF